MSDPVNPPAVLSERSRDGRSTTEPNSPKLQFPRFFREQDIADSIRVWQFPAMSTVQEIERAIERLPREEAFLLADWISSRISKEWDQEIEEDIKAGRLDVLAQQSVSEFRAGRTTPYPPREE